MHLGVPSKLLLLVGRRITRFLRSRLGVGFGSLLIGTGQRSAYPCPLHRTVTRHLRRIRMM